MKLEPGHAIDLSEQAIGESVHIEMMKQSCP